MLTSLMPWQPFNRARLAITNKPAAKLALNFEQSFSTQFAISLKLGALCEGAEISRQPVWCYSPSSTRYHWYMSQTGRSPRMKHSEIVGVLGPRTKGHGLSTVHYCELLLDLLPRYYPLNAPAQRFPRTSPERPEISPLRLAFSCDVEPTRRRKGARTQWVTQNVSVGGLLINLGDEAPLHSRVSLKMSVEGPKSRRPVLLHGEGQVVRVDSLGPGAGFAIAVECSRCIREMSANLPGPAQ